MCTFTPSQAAQASTTADEAAYIAQLEAIVAQLTAVLTQLLALQATNDAAPAVVDSAIEPNYLIIEASVDESVLSGNSMGEPLPSQTIELRVRNDETGSISAPGSKLLSYEAVVYEKVSGPDIKTNITASGEMQLPDGDEDYYYSVIFEGGLPFDEDEEDFERTFYAVITLDADDDISETDEDDNTFTSPTWVMEYYEG